MEKFDYLKVVDKGNGIVNVQLNRPPANAFHVDMYNEVRNLFSDIDQVGDDVRAVILSAGGRFFCAGNDLDEFAAMDPENAPERQWRTREAFFAISDCAVPVIGAVHGVALGTGLAIAASCDVIVAAKGSKFGLPELTVGVMGGARHLARIAPQPVVRRMYFTGVPMEAEEFAAAGGAVIVCELEELMEQAEIIAARVAQYSPTAVRVSKRILDRIEWMDLKTGYEFEQKGTIRMSGHPDSTEALMAFKEKREPNYEPLNKDRKWYGV